MNIVIQCAGRKNGQFFKTENGKEIFFVADPALAPKDDAYLYAHPDDQADSKLTWRQTLLSYSKSPDNPLNLVRAFELYKNPIYKQLVDKFGLDKVFILSAGWGLINAAFLTPYYDITFSLSVKRKGQPYKFRSNETNWSDLCQLPTSNEPVVFFGGKDYMPMFLTLTHSYQGKRIAFYNSKVPPRVPNCILQRYHTATRTNWQYECAMAFIGGGLTLKES
ncbi:hypothetical protein M9H61_13600 [Thalassospira sp. GO-4]|jgi:hypothetical protein|uniref:hypothetical protein n=1 Tax=Thalassospira sp. GO-4 TaxID=2946605 RepID=UPI0020256DBA|nr:hypothetical protein [Thalassospira sp. GO-4]URK16579.1 hypothetical protein M9H61_13600 [Thalassospira sp. GO-4]